MVGGDAMAEADMPGMLGARAPGAAEPGWLGDARALRCGAVERVARRCADVLIALLCLLVVGPLMALTALLVRLDSPGPALCRQQLVGLNGRLFTLFRFRSTYNETGADVAEHDDAWLAGDAAWRGCGRRLTRLGSFIRRTRIEELPQVFNVLRGDMSLIGPSAEPPKWHAQWAEAIPHYADRLRVKPGVTGWAQVNLVDGPTYEDTCDKLAYDLHYIRVRNVLLDARILLALLRIILFDGMAR